MPSLASENRRFQEASSAPAGLFVIDANGPVVDHPNLDRWQATMAGNASTRPRPPARNTAIGGDAHRRRLETLNHAESPPPSGKRGEARLIDAMVPRGLRILDAGCGPDRVGGVLADAGHEVVGVDLDPVLIAAAEQDHPGPMWLVEDLAALDLSARGIDEGFDAIVCAGNVMTFLAPATRGQVREQLRAHLRSGGRVVVGLGTKRGYDVDEFRSHVDAAGLVPELLLSTWSLAPYRDDADFVVAILRSAEDAAHHAG